MQSVHCRGVHRHSTPGHTLVLHPDEVHAGSDRGFRYRMLYVPPAIIQDILGRLPLPFIPGGITRDSVLASAVVRLLRYIDSSLERFEEDDALFDLAQAMRRHAGHRDRRKHLDYPAAQRARAYLDSATGPDMDCIANICDEKTFSALILAHPKDIMACDASHVV